jgi:hypothetical protein
MERAKKSHTLHASMFVFGFFTRPYPDESGLIAPIGESIVLRGIGVRTKTFVKKE